VIFNHLTCGYIAPFHISPCLRRQPPAEIWKLFYALFLIFFREWFSSQACVKNNPAQWKKGHSRVQK